MIKHLIHRPISVFMAFIALFILGIITYMNIPVSLLPDIAIPEITVQISGKNTSARELEYTISCTVAQQNSSGQSWYWNASAGTYVYGIPVGVGVGGGSSGSSDVNYSPMTFLKDVCGSGVGLCLQDAPSNHPCS